VGVVTLMKEPVCYVQHLRLGLNPDEDYSMRVAARVFGALRKSHR
jgi:hypothetical protein